jgi:uncharacterized protein YndB with AHSA1/START domain
VQLLKENARLRLARSSDCEVVLTRYFEAPREAIFDALTKLEMLDRWFGPVGWSVIDSKLELRVGGACDLTMRGPDGTKMRMHAVYREIARPDRIVRRELFEGWPAVESIVTLTVRDGGTLLTAKIVYPSSDVCEADLAAGLEHDAAGAYDKLDECLRSREYSG